MDRRGFLGTAAAALLTGCAARRITVAPPGPLPPALAPVEVTPRRVIRTVCGLRPYRPSGFVVRTEIIGNKPVVHNYGHGGAGITLCWGTAHLAAEEALRAGQTDAAVLGCGAVGLATARTLQRRGFSVTIYTKDTPPDTTSNIAGGYWSPVTLFDRARATPAFLDQYERAARIAHRFYQNMVGDYYGVRWLPMYQFGQEPIRSFEPGSARARIAGLFPDAHELAPGEHPFPAAHVLRFYAMLIEPPVFLNAVLRDFLLQGGRLVIRQLETPMDAVSLPHPIIVNCTGLGSHALFGDQELTPVKGQLSFLPPDPRIDYMTIGMDHGTYMFPRHDGILLGGTHEEGNWSLEPDEEAKARILAEHARVFGSFARRKGV